MSRIQRKSSHGTELANFLGHLSPASIRAKPDVSSGAGISLASAIHLILDGFRVNFPSHLTVSTQPVLHLAYWHTRLLYSLLSPSSRSEGILQDCEKLVGILTANPQLISPLTHHFVALVSLVLLELDKAESTKEEAVNMMQRLLEVSLPPSPWNSAVREKLGKKDEPSTGGAPSQNLQQLADVATATKPSVEGVEDTADESIVRFKTLDNYAGQGFDPAPVLQAGYLKAFVPDEGA
jgi:hypothetical protein